MKERTLQERDAEVDELGEVIASARTGAGGALLLEGPAGIGKSSLLAVGAEIARRAGLAVLRARAGELEQGFAYVVVRQLFEPLLATADDARRAALLAGAAQHAAPVCDPQALPGEVPEGDDFTRLHGLYWLCANLAADQPVALVVDDLQWADEPSLRFLAFLARRIADLPVALLATSRPRAEAAREALDALAGDPALRVVTPAPLTAEGVGGVLASRLGRAPEPGFARACRAVSGGNPFLVGQLARAISLDRLEPVDAQADRVLELGPKELGRVLLLRLARLPEGAAALAQAVALLGDGAPAAACARLAGLDDPATTSAVTALVAADIVTEQDGLAFTHPLVREAIYDEMDPFTRARRHGDAAAVRHAEGAPAREVAAQLLLAGDDVGAWAVGALRDAAREALALGDAPDALACLRRALELAGGEEREDIRADLAHAEAQAGDPAAVDRMRMVLDTATDPERISRVSLELAGVLMFADRSADAVAVLRAGAERLAGAPDAVRERIELGLIGAGFLSLGARKLAADRFARMRDPGGRPATLLEALHVSGLALDGAMEPLPADVVADRARRGLAFGVPADPTMGGNPVLLGTIALAFADQLEEADAMFRAGLAEARANGAGIAVAALSSLRSLVSYRRGALLEAEADAQTALLLAAEIRGAEALTVNAIAMAIHTGLDRGAPDEELRALARLAPDDLEPDLIPMMQLVLARARLEAERGDPGEAVRRYLALDRPDPGWSANGPSVLPWRSGVAPVLAALGEQERAAELAAEEVRLARMAGTPRALGVALRVAALLREGAEREDGLREAVAVQAAGPSRLEHARALLDLGAVQRGAGDRAEAKATLEEARELAARCAADALVARADTELEAAGARARRRDRADRDALTPSERRVAEMAARGQTNREIAQALFVSEKTVENHLTKVYGKLGIRRRAQLAGALPA